VPRYPGSVRTDYLSIPGKRMRITVVGYITSASVDEVVNFYKEKLLSNGWTDIEDWRVEGTIFLVGQKDGRSVKVTISFDEDYLNYTSVLIVISE